VRDDASGGGATTTHRQRRQRRGDLVVRKLERGFLAANEPVGIFLWVPPSAAARFVRAEPLERAQSHVRLGERAPHEAEALHTMRREHRVLNAPRLINRCTHRLRVSLPAAEAVHEGGLHEGRRRAAGTQSAAAAAAAGTSERNATKGQPRRCAQALHIRWRKHVTNRGRLVAARTL
jgi:hypothetical protein